ncbi:monosaccharide-sensing protein 2-like isoform X2 [Phragmites australis]|nr:monosaccharide-sensing protein 2-like isoform X2 [Phragmites australis]
MRGAVLVAIAAAIGNMLQGWDNATIAGAVLYIKREFHLESQPAIEGLVIATSLIGATVITTFSGPVSDSVGRRPMLIASSLLYFFSGLMMLWSPNVYVLLLSRLVDGFGVGLAVTLVPVYISETAPPEIRGLLNTLPQFTGSGGMFLSYCMIFAMTLAPQPNWRLMLGVLFLPSLLYLLVTVCYLPESPRWLVSKGRMKEARAVLQMLRGREDVEGEMALLVEGLGTGGDTAIEEYIVGPPPDAQGLEYNEANVTLYGPERGMSWVAQPVPLGSQGSMLGSAIGLASRQGSMLDHLKDPVVALLDSVHDLKPPGADAMSMRGGGSMLFSNLGSMLSFHDKAPVDWDEENVRSDDDKDGWRSDDDSNLRTPLLDARGHSSLLGEAAATTMGIGGGWQLAWKYTDGPESGVKRMYLHEEGSGEPGAGGVHAAALVSQSALYSKTKQGGMEMEGPAFVHPAVVSEEDKKVGGARWRELLEPGVRHALVCGVTMQILQQFSGINGVLYYTPQILNQAGVSVLLSSLGLSAESTSILISGLTTLLMLPTIGVAMRLMDVSGRRSLLLWTIPVLIASLAVLVAASVVPMAATAHAALATGSVIVYLCCFVMGFGPIPNILCAEIFPTRVRGMCIAICSLAFWLGDIAVAYSLPVMLNAVGLAGVFGIYAVVCCVALGFVALRVPETKGLPLEVIIEFFNVGAKGLPNNSPAADEQCH